MRKLIALLTAMVMLLLPVMGMAASPAEMLDAAWNNGGTMITNVTFELAELPLEEKVRTVLSDVVNTLGFRVEADADGRTRFAVTLQGKDAATMAAESAGDDMYIDLPLVSRQVMAFNAEEAKVVIRRVIDMVGEASGMSEAEMAQAKAAFDAGFENSEATMTTMGDVQMPDIDLSALLFMFMGSMEFSTVAEQPADCDPAASVLKITVTPDMVRSAMTMVADAVKASPDAMASLNNAGVEWTLDGRSVTLEEFLAEAPAVLANGLEETYGNIPVTVLMNVAGEPVSITVAMTDVNNGESEALVYTRQSRDDGVHYNVQLTADGEGMSLLLVNNCTENRTDYSFTVFQVAGGQKSGVLLDSSFVQTRDRGDQTAHDVTDVRVMCYTGDPATGFVNLTMNMDQAAQTAGNNTSCDTVVQLGCDKLGGTVLTVKVNTAVNDTQLPSIVAADAVRPGAMNDDEFAAFVENASNCALTGAFAMLQLLPPSVLQLVMGM